MMLLEPICRTCKYIKPVNAKKVRIFIFFNPRIVFGTHFGQFENSLLLSDFKPPLAEFIRELNEPADQSPKFSSPADGQSPINSAI